MQQRWKEDLENYPYGTHTIEALLPSFMEWIGRSHGTVTFRLAQVMTGHGCFGHYLCRIKREANPACHECGAPDDTAQHTLEECSRWAVERRTMTAALEVGNLSLRNVVAAMLGSERKWKAVASFCEIVISQKEAAERERESRADAHPNRRTRRGRRRAQFAALLNP
ncbi:uncharacterized protein LOC134792333 [Cydia splendana]|uniref:uncharacterized protein LOC134792333 n=1 Tax=Cydia splendana TaxID=1100963 RepID=UPI00300D9E72